MHILYMIRDISFNSQKGFLKGLILVVAILLTLAFVNSYEYNMNYSVVPETNLLTLQQGSNYSVFIDYKFNTSKELDFSFEVLSPEGITVYYAKDQKSFYDFRLPLRVFVSNDIPLGEYYIKLKNVLNYEGIKSVKETIIKVNVVEKSNILFETDKYTNELPNLIIKNTSQKNFLIKDEDKKQIIFTLTNTGSSANYYLDYFIDSKDKNKVHVEFDNKYIVVQKDSEKNVLVNITFDANYDIDFTRIYFFANEVSTNKEYSLGTANFTKSVNDIMVIFNKENRTLNLINTGNNISQINIVTQNKTYNLLLRPTQDYLLSFDNLDKNIQVYLDKKLFSEFVLNESDIVDKNKDSSFSLMPITGFFSMSDESTIAILFGLGILLFILLIYKMFLSKNPVFGKNYYAKDLDLK